MTRTNEDRERELVKRQLARHAQASERRHHGPTLSAFLLAVALSGIAVLLAISGVAGRATIFLIAPLLVGAYIVLED